MVRQKENNLSDTYSLVVFFCTDKAGAKQVERRSFVYDLLKVPGEMKPATIPDEQIDKFKFVLGNCDSDK